MTKNLTLRSLLIGAFLLPAVVALAVPVTPTYDLFGNLPGATFNGTAIPSGIPTDPTAITTIDLGGGNIITLGLTAHYRYYNPVLGNDGAGTFSAGPGANDGLEPGNPHSIGATWNFGFYVNVAGGGSLSDYRFKLFYDLDPGAGTDHADLGVIDFTGVPGTTAQDSWNSTFLFLNGGVTPGVTLPAYTPFDPNAIGEYSFSLEASSIGGGSLGSSAINVNVNSVPDAGSTIALLGLALTGLGFGVRRFRA